MLMEARGLLLRGWSQGAQARDETGQTVQAWSQEAASWSLLGSLLASWYRHNESWWRPIKENDPAFRAYYDTQYGGRRG